VTAKPKWRVAFDQMATAAGWTGELDPRAPLEQARAVRALMDEAVTLWRQGSREAAQVKVIGAVRIRRGRARAPAPAQPIVRALEVTPARAELAFGAAPPPAEGEHPMAPGLRAWAALLGRELVRVEEEIEKRDDGTRVEITRIQTRRI